MPAGCSMTMLSSTLFTSADPLDASAWATTDSLGSCRSAISGCKIINYNTNEHNKRNHKIRSNLPQAFLADERLVLRYIPVDQFQFLHPPPKHSLLRWLLVLPTFQHLIAPTMNSFRIKSNSQFDKRTMICSSVSISDRIKGGEAGIVSTAASADVAPDSPLLIIATDKTGATGSSNSSC